MIKTTRWSPDTCGCTIDYIWDTESSDATRVHAFKQVVELCPVHAAHGKSVAVYNAILDENGKKNKVYNRAMEVLGRNNQMFNPSELTWSFDSNRNLKVVAPVLSAAQKTALRSWCTTNLGAGKVTIS